MMDTPLSTRVTNIRKYHLVSKMITSFTMKNKKIGKPKLVISTRLTTIFILDPSTKPVIESDNEYTLSSSRSQNITKFEAL